MKRSLHGQRYVACYARVSTDDQAREGVSLDAQAARLRAFCSAVRPDDEVRMLVEAGTSAKTLQRPVLGQILADCKAGRVKAVVVLKLDRLTRSVRDLADLLDLFERHDVALCSLSESLDTSTASGRLMLNLLTSVAQWEREAIAERTAFALAHKRRSGQVYGPVPFGYRRRGDKLVANAQQRTVLRRIRAMRAKGKSLRSIIGWLNERGVKTPRGSKKWYVNTLYQVLKSKAHQEITGA